MCEETLSMEVRAVSHGTFKTTSGNSALVVQLDYFPIGYNEYWQIELRCVRYGVVAIAVSSKSAHAIETLLNTTATSQLCVYTSQIVDYA